MFVIGVLSCLYALLSGVTCTYNKFHRLDTGYRHTALSKSGYACSAERLQATDKYICNSNGNIICLKGWSNPSMLCEIPICETKCGHGKCIGPNVCACELGW
ncbi:Uncharacterized protein FKW44_023473, partial [Caligus rogercresseyi]